MGNSLRDQLLKAGLVDKKQAKKAKQEVDRKKRNIRKGKEKESEEDKKLLQEMVSKQVQRDIELNKRKNEEAQRKAIKAEISDLVKKNKVKKTGGNPDEDEAFNFVFKERVKKIYVSKENKKLLTNGRLAVIRFNNVFEIVPDDIAEKIESRNSAIVIRSSKSEAEEIPDEYSEYQIPDDLTW